MRPTGAHNPKASNKTSVKEQIRRISAIRVPLNPCGRRKAMNTRKYKYQWIKIWGKIDNDIFFLFLFIDVLLYSRHYKNCGKALSVMLKNCGNSVLP